ncbi:hypothetical protein ACH5RR_038087 [Cinchona calisaya]|uniref:Uncharacterized protein n=1 Tax=Cinchona calisaya TaxID=153742 RepID=A0ABD2Y821_9GENT
MLSQLCVKRKSAMISSLMVLDIFEKAVVALEGYLESMSNDVRKEHAVRDVMKLLQEFGFSVQYKDVEISNMHYRSRLEILTFGPNIYDFLQLLLAAGKSRVNASLDEAPVISPYVPQGSYPNTHICGMQNAVKNSVPVKYLPEASSFAFSAESRRVFWTSKANYSSGVGLKKNTGQRVLANRELIRLCLLFKRGIRYI